MTTIVSNLFFQGVCKNIYTYRVTNDNHISNLYVKNLDEGNCILLYQKNTDLKRYIRCLINFFDTNSNFNKVVTSSFNVSYLVEKVTFTYDKVTYSITKENLDPDIIYNDIMYREKEIIKKRHSIISLKETFLRKDEPCYFIHEGKYDNFNVFFSCLAEIWVKSFNSKTITIYLNDISPYMVKSIEYAFNPNSNFMSLVKKVYDSNYIPEYVILEYSNIVLSFPVNNFNEGEFRHKVKNFISSIINHEKVWLKSDKGLRYKEYQKKISNEFKDLKNDILNIDKELTYDLKDSFPTEDFEGYISATSKDASKTKVLDYAILWAKYMQSKIAKGEDVFDIADNTLKEIDLLFDILDNYFEVICILVKTWKYGEKIMKWHNTKYGYTKDGIVDTRKILPLIEYPIYAIN